MPKTCRKAMQSFFPAGLFKERRFFYVRDTRDTRDTLPKVNRTHGAPRVGKRGGARATAGSANPEAWTLGKGAPQRVRARAERARRAATGRVAAVIRTSAGTECGRWLPPLGRRRQAGKSVPASEERPKEPLIVINRAVGCAGSMPAAHEYTGFLPYMNGSE